MFAAHCEYLQLFPTLNFMTAALLLSSWTLRSLVGNMRAYTQAAATASTSVSGSRAHARVAGVLVEMLQKKNHSRFRHKDVLVSMLEQCAALLDAHAGLQYK